MTGRRDFLRIVPVAAVSTSVIPGRTVRADDGNARTIMGAWNTTHSLPFPPGFFREFLTFAQGSVVNETNSFLNTSSNLDFSAFGLPAAVNASDGFGVWERVSDGIFRAGFRKLLFDGSGHNFGDLHVTGTLRSDGLKLAAEWHVVVLDVEDHLLLDFGPATSEGVRIH